MSKPKEALFQNAQVKFSDTPSPTATPQMANDQTRFLQLQEQIVENIKQFNQNCSLGFQACLQSAQDLSSSDSNISMSQLKDNIHQAFEQISSLEKMQQLAQAMSQGTRFSDLIGLHSSCLWMLYKGAKRLLDSQSYEEAEAAFCFLTFMDQTKPAFWLGLGHASFHLEHFSRASTAYQMASVTDPCSYWPLVFISNCYEATQEPRKAQSAMEEALRRFTEQGQSDTYIEEAMLQRLQTISQNSGAVSKS